MILPNNRNKSCFVYNWLENRNQKYYSYAGFIAGPGINQANSSNAMLVDFGLALGPSNRIFPPSTASVSSEAIVEAGRSSTGAPA